MSNLSDKLCHLYDIKKREKGMAIKAGDLKDAVKELKEKLFVEAIDRDLTLKDTRLDRLTLELIGEVIDEIAPFDFSIEICNFLKNKFG